MKVYICRKLRVLNHLLNAGFEYINQQPDIRNPKYNVWLFEETPALRAAVEEYYDGDYFTGQNR